MARLLAFRRRFGQALLRVVTPALVRLDVQKQAAVPAGPLLIAPNHLAHLDPWLVITLLDRPPEVVALADLWHEPIAPVLWFYEPIPVHRDQADRALLTRVVDALQAGQQVVLFPEARISTTGALERAREGIGYLALKAGVPVVPVAITGTETAYTTWRRGRRPQVRIVIGRALTFTSSGHRRHSERAAATTAIMEAIARLLPPEYRGAYPLENALGSKDMATTI